VASGAGADRRQVEALVAAGCAGIVVAATGNGMVHRDLDAALRRAAAAGVAVLRSSRCLLGGIVEGDGRIAAPEGRTEARDDQGDEAHPSAGVLTPPKARVELILRLLAARRAA
jgi:L-asparaginase